MKNMKKIKSLYAIYVVFAGLAMLLISFADSPKTTDIIENTSSENQQETFNVRANKAYLIRVVDGDTIKYSYNENKKKDSEETCRVFGIDTLESSNNSRLKKIAEREKLSSREVNQSIGEGKRATKRGKELLEGKSIKIRTYGKDYYGRTLCRILIDAGNGEHTIDYGYEMVKGGFAIVYKQGLYAADKTYYNKMMRVERDAESENRGTWATLPRALKAFRAYQGR